jgi:HEAT repeat protein
VSSSFADSIEIINKNNEVEKIKFYEPINSPIFGDVSQMKLGLEDIDTMMLSADYMNRALAAAVIADGKISDTAKCVELLVNALEKEINQPLSDELASEFSWTVTEFLLGQYLYDLRVLLYTKGSEFLKPYLHSSAGEMKTLLILAAGLLGDKEVRDDIRQIYLENENGFIRSAAIQVMNIFPEMKDLPVLKNALNDEYLITDRFGNERSPIRGAASGALIKLGFSIEEVEEMRSYKE